MRDKEKIKMLEQQIELLEKVIELPRGMLAALVITVTPIVTREVYPVYPSYPSYPPCPLPWITPYPGYGTGDPLPAWPAITCQG